MRKNIFNKESLKMRTFFVFIFLLAILFVLKANKVDAAGLNVGTNNLILSSGQNLFYGAMSGSSNVGASALLLEKPAGTTLFKVTSGGNVGIGTANPLYKLQISGNEQLVVGSPGSGQSFVAGSKVNDPGGGVAYGAYWAYDAYFDEVANIWMPVRDSLGRKWKTEINYHSGKYTIDYSSGYNPISWTNFFTIQSNGNVGIGITNPTEKLHVVGGAQFTALSYGVTPGSTQTLSLATVEYVNGKMSDGYLPLTGGTLSGNLNMGGNDISNVNKLTVVTVDPLYRIGGINYSSFAPSVVGGVKEEIIGRVKVNDFVKVGEYEKVIDFSKVKEGSDLWVWRKTVDFSRDNVEVLMTPYGGFADTYYKIEGEKIILRSNKPITISYRLIGHRIDWKKWPTKAIDQHETPGFVID